jgi:glutathione S-transferase
MLLAHLGIDYESEMLFGVEFEERLAFAQPEAKRLGTRAPYAPHGTVPVLVDGDRILPDSWTIAAYLDDRYGDGRIVNAFPTVNRFFDAWVTRTVNAVLFPILLPDTIALMDEIDRDPFRRSREQMFGFRFADIEGALEERVPALREQIQPLEEALESDAYLGGAEPIYADFIVFGIFVWLSRVATHEVLAADSALYRWREQLMDAYDGVARV